MLDMKPDKHLPLDEAVRAGWFDGFQKFIHKDTDGFLHFTSESLEEVLDYLRTQGVEELSKTFWSFLIDGKWTLRWDYEFRFKKARKKKKGKKIKHSDREMTDKDHLNIKGQKNYRRWG